MWDIKISNKEGNFFKTKNFKPDGEMISMQYSDSYIHELIDSEEVYNQNKCKLRITIKEVR